MAAKKTPRPVPRRQRESPVEPGHMMPVEPPQLRDMTREQARHTVRQVGASIESTTGGKFQFQHAVDARTNAVLSGLKHQKEENAFTASTALPRHFAWYNEHQQAGRETAQATGAPLGRALDTSAMLSVRNAPENERMAARSALHIAMNPDQPVHVSQQLAPHVGEWESRGAQGTVQTSNLMPGVHRLGDLSTREAASLGYGAAKVEMAGGEHQIPPELGDVSRRAAGRPSAGRGMRVARGEPFSEVTRAPKISSYATAAHTASPEEATHNEMRTYELANIEGAGKKGIPTTEEVHGFHHPEEGQQSWSYDELHPGMRERVLDEHQHDPTAEDYVMNAMTAHRAHQQGQPEWSVNKALDIVGHGVQKGKASSLPADVSKDEMLHAVNTAATQASARELGMTPVATQASAWMPFRQQVLGEDSEWNARQRQIEKEKKGAAAVAAKAAAPVSPTAEMPAGGMFAKGGQAKTSMRPPKEHQHPEAGRVGALFNDRRS